GADVICVMVPDSPDVQDVLEGENGVFQNAETGALIIDFSSIRPDVTQQLAEQARALGFRLLDAPVSGGEAGAKDAALSIMDGGEAGVVVPLGALVGQLVASARANGDGGLDHSALLRGVERLSGKAVV